VEPHPFRKSPGRGGISDLIPLSNRHEIVMTEQILNNVNLAEANRALRGQEPHAIIRWALAQAEGRALVSTNFRPYEAVLLHLCVSIQPDIPVLWVDHGYNRPATYRYADLLIRRLNLNLKLYVPRVTAAYRDALFGPVPQAGDEEALKRFSAVMKLEPFQRGMSELRPKVWLTALRKVQNPDRAELDIVSPDANFGTLKVSPVFPWSDAMMDDYLKRCDLPNEWDYFDPAKAEDKRECGLHAAWGKTAVAPRP
jgi:phosphoadenosine phosphosulfate reductase